MSQANKDYSIKIAVTVHLLPYCQGPRQWGQNGEKNFSIIFATICHTPKWI